MIEEIQKWFDGPRDYDTGAALYDQYGTSSSLKRLHRMNGKTKANMDSITYELQKLIKGKASPVRTVPLNKINPEKEKAHDPQESPVPEQEPLTTDRRSNTPEADDLKDHIIDLLKARDQLFATLEHVSREQRGRDAARIIALSNEITGCYHKMEHYNKHGVVPDAKKKEDAKKASQMSEAELIKHQANLRTYVSRYKKKLTKVKDPLKIHEYQELLDRYQLELTDVEKRLTK